MKYLLLDTNIYLNIAVNRRKDVNNKLLKNFSKLLHYGEIRVILPAIVRHEVFKHLEAEISKVGENLERAKRKVDDIYWINGIDQGTFNINDYKKNAKMYIQEAYDYFNKNKEIYITEVENQINSIFKSKYTIFVDDSEVLINKALKRKIYKKAPCHKIESYADAIIAEVLINSKEYIDVKSDDTIYFLSDNPKDFSKNDEKYKNTLHPHIRKDLEKNQLNELVEYRLNFGKFIMMDLSEEIENANVKEEFEKEFEEEQAMEEATYYSDLEDMDREAAGLTSLSSFDDWVYESIAKSKEVRQILNLFEKLNKVYIDLEEIHSFYWDEFSNILNVYMNEDASDKVELISKFNEFIIQNELKYYCYTIEDIINWVDEQENKLDFDCYDMSLPDYIDINEGVILIDANKENILLSWENTELSPESRESHTIYCDVKKDYSKNLIAEGRVEITYGFMEFNSCGNAGDGCQEDIDIRLELVVEAIENLYEELDKLRYRHRSYIDYINENIIVENSTSGV